ncbi:retrovirus-related pol polyprotein from transposon TNT 1-94 [Tanacetum coccineum]
MKEGSSLKDYLDALNSILMDLKNVELKIDDKDAALILLVSLPPSFDNFVNSFVIGKDAITLEMSNPILHSPNASSSIIGGTSEISTCKGKGRYKYRSKSRPRGSNPRDTCNYCKEEGHWKFNCPKLKEKGQVAAIAKDDCGSERDVDTFIESCGGHVIKGVMNTPCKVDGALVVMKATKGTSSLYTLQGEMIIGYASVSCLEKSNSDLMMLWHKCLGHMNEKGIVILSKRRLLDNHNVASLVFCEHCVIGKQKRVSLSKAIHQTKGTLDYLHADCWGPSRIPSLGGARYFLSIIDDFSRMTWVFMMKHKSEAFEKFKHWKILIENQTGRKIKRLRTDNGLEFCSREFNDFCRDEGIARHYTVRYTPQQNGVAERMNRTLLERTRCQLLNAGLDRSFWAEALNTACYLINRSPATAIDCKTPIEVWSGKPADYSKLRVFGCPAYYHVSEGKLDPRGEKGIFMGYGEGVKGYRIWSPSEIRVEDVPKQVEHIIPRDMDHNVTSRDDHTNFPHLDYEQDRTIVHDRPHRNEKCPSRFGFEDYVAYALQVTEEVESLKPATYREAITSKDSDIFKATFGAKGYSQKEGIDYNEIFSPVVRHTSIRVLLSLVEHHELEQLDVKTAFLHGDLVEEIYMSQPEGFVVQGKEDYDCKLPKYLSKGTVRAHLSTYICTVMICVVAAKDMEKSIAVKRNFRYLKGTFDVGLIYDGDREYLVVRYSDSDYAADLDAKRSLTGYVFTINRRKEFFGLTCLIEVLLVFPQDLCFVIA